MSEMSSKDKRHVAKHTPSVGSRRRRSIDFTSVLATAVRPAKRAKRPFVPLPVVLIPAGQQRTAAVKSQLTTSAMLGKRDADEVAFLAAIAVEAKEEAHPEEEEEEDMEEEEAVDDQPEEEPVADPSVRQCDHYVRKVIKRLRESDIPFTEADTFDIDKRYTFAVHICDDDRKALDAAFISVSWWGIGVDKRPTVEYMAPGSKYAMTFIVDHSYRLKIKATAHESDILRVRDVWRSMCADAPVIGREELRTFIKCCLKVRVAIYSNDEPLNPVSASGGKHHPSSAHLEAMREESDLEAPLPVFALDQIEFAGPALPPSANAVSFGSSSAVNSPALSGASSSSLFGSLPVLPQLALNESVYAHAAAAAAAASSYAAAEATNAFAEVGFGVITTVVGAGPLPPPPASDDFLSAAPAYVPQKSAALPVSCVID